MFNGTMPLENVINDDPDDTEQLLTNDGGFSGGFGVQRVVASNAWG